MVLQVYLCTLAASSSLAWPPVFPFQLNLTVCAQSTGVPVHTRRILLRGLPTRSLCQLKSDLVLKVFWCTRPHSPHPPPWPNTASYIFAHGVPWLTAYYWAIMTMTTIGYGDVLPVTVG